jgi:hypothetical protein
MKVSLKVWVGGKVVIFVNGEMGKETRRLGNSLRKCGVQGLSTLRVQPARRAAKTRAQNSTPTQKKRATLLAFGEIGFAGGFGEVASAAVVGQCS